MRFSKPKGAEEMAEKDLMWTVTAFETAVRTRGEQGASAGEVWVLTSIKSSGVIPPPGLGLCGHPWDTSGCMCVLNTYK